MQNIRLLPRFRPLKAGESFSGYLLRRAQMNAYSCLHDITNVVGVRTSQDGLGSAQGSFEDLCKLLELDRDEAINHLFWYTGEKCRERAWLFGNVPLGAGLVDLKRPKLCPECLEEDEFIRAEWELTFFTVCPRHGRPLVETCLRCGSRIGWGRQCIRRCKSCGSDFASSSATASADEVFLARMMVDKLYAQRDSCSSRSFNHLQSSISLNGLTDVSIFIGGLLSGLSRIDASRTATLSLERRREIMRRASSVINEEWPHGVRQLVDQFLLKDSINARTGSDLLPGLYKPMIWRYRREGYRELASEMGQYLFECHPALFSTWHGQSALFQGARGSVTLESVSDFCKRVGICKRYFDQYASHLKLPHNQTRGARRTRKRLSQDEADLVEAEVRRRRANQSSIPLKSGEWMSFEAFRRGEGFPCEDFNGPLAHPLSISAVAQRLGISAEATKRVMQAVGALEPAPDNRELKSFKHVSFSTYADFERNLASKIAQVVNRGGTQSGIGVGTAVRNKLRRYDIDTATLITWILRGVVKVNGADRNAYGLDRILLSEEDISDAMVALRTPRSDAQLNAEGVRELLQLPRIGVVYELRRAGHIRGRQTGAKSGGNIVFELSSIEKFRRRYITLSELLSLSRTASGPRGHGRIRKLLGAAGIEPEFKLTAGGNSTPFYDRESCKRIKFTE